MRKTSAALAGLLLLGSGLGCGSSDSGPTPRPSPSPFLTTTISGLQLWFKADAITGLAAGDPVLTWPDSSGGGFDATSGGSPPVFRTGVSNGWPVVRFSGLNYLTSAKVPASGNTSRTVIAVVKNVSITDLAVKYNHVLHWGAYASPGSADISYGLVVSCNSGQAGGSKMGNHYNLDGFSSSFTASTDTMLIETSYDGATDTFYLNGNSGGSKSVALNTTSAGIVIGARVDHLDEFLSGDIAEILIYSPAISASDRGVVENYLAYKYAIY